MQNKWIKFNLNILVGPVIILVIWWLITAIGLVDTLFLVSPQVAFAKLWNLLISGEILPDLFATLLRMLLGFAIAVAIGVPLGLLLGSSKKLYSYFEFVIDFFRSLPATALFPLFMLIFGIGDTAKIAVVVFIATWVIIINTAYGVFHTPKGRFRYLQTLKAKKTQIIREATIPEAIPHIIVGLRTALSLSLVVVIAVEMFIGTRVGLGQRIFNSELTFRIPELYATILLAGIIGYLLNKIFLSIETKFIHWTGK